MVQKRSPVDQNFEPLHPLNLLNLEPSLNHFGTFSEPFRNPVSHDGIRAGARILTPLRVDETDSLSPGLAPSGSM